MALLLHFPVCNKLPYMSAAIPHVLVIDDNEAILESMAMVLRWNALRVSTTNRMNDFTEEVNTIHPDLILLDKALGWADGCDLCAGLKMDTTTQHIRVIMLSAFHHVKEKCLSAGADAFLEKPFDLNELLQLVYSFTGRAQWVG
jgi:DNA-binding response OmpR family regulator